ncbi:MAG: hypothetical protein ABIP30_06490 [Ferruginibacter sp.]
MKKISISFWLAAILVLAACNNNNRPITENKLPVIDTAQTPKFANLQLTSKRDTSCGMPLRMEDVADTVVLKGKVYGFCSAECKADFVTILKKEHKR